MARRVSKEPPIQVKKFESIQEINQGITKLRRRIEEVKGLDPGRIRSDSQEVEITTQNIRKTLLEIFGHHSPEFREHQHHSIVYWRGVMRLGWDHQRELDFAEGIPRTLSLLEGLIRGLEEKKEDFVPPEPRPSDPRPAPQGRSTTLNIGSVERLALGDINELNVTVVAVLGAIADALEGKPDIPPEEKEPLVHKLRDLVKHPLIVSLGSGTIMELIKRALAGG